MIKLIRSAAIALAILTPLGLAAAAAAPASAAVRAPSFLAMQSNSQGEAGIVTVEHNGWRIRDVQGSFTLNAALRDLNGSTTAGPGALGGEQCDPNSGKAVQVGAFWDKTQTPAQFVVEYGAGTLSTPVGGSDPCIQGGLIDGGLTGTRLLSNITIGSTDRLSLEQYFNPVTGWETITATDVTQDVSRTAHFYEGKFTNFYEAGFGADTQNGPSLVPPATNQLVTVTGRETNYGAKHASKSFRGGWDEQLARFTNDAAQVLLTPGQPNAAGSSFTLFVGGIVPAP
jgi:hypothetical protein